MRVFRRFFLSPSAGAAALLLLAVFLAAFEPSVLAGALEAVEAGALPAVEAGYGSSQKGRARARLDCTNFGGHLNCEGEDKVSNRSRSVAIAYNQTDPIPEGGVVVGGEETYTVKDVARSLK